MRRVFLLDLRLTISARSCELFLCPKNCIYQFYDVSLQRSHHFPGPNKIVVPEAFFKVVLCLNGKPKGIGFIRRNTETTRRNDLYINSIREVERITGMTFFPNLPKEIAESVKSQANLRDWDQELFRQR